MMREVTLAFKKLTRLYHPGRRNLNKHFILQKGSDKTKLLSNMFEDLKDINILYQTSLIYPL